MPQIIGFVVVVFAVFTLIEYVLIPLFVYLMVVAFQAALVAAFSAGGALAVSRMALEAFRPATRSSATHRVEVQASGRVFVSPLAGGMFGGEADHRRWFNGVLAASLLAVGSAVGTTGAYAGHQIFKNVVAASPLTGVLVLAVSGLVLLLVHMKLYGLCGAAQAQEAATLRHEVSGWHGLIDQSRRAGRALEAMGASLQLDADTELRAFVDAHQEAVIDDVHVIDREIERRTVDALQFANRAHDCSQRWLAVQGLLQRVGHELLATNSPAMFGVLDALLTTHADAAGYVVKRDFGAFDRMMDEIATDANNLLFHATHAGDEDTSQAPGDDHSDPYVVLGVERQMTLEAIKEVAKRLLQIYHPDRGLVRDDTRFKQIQGAWSAVKATHSDAGRRANP